MIRQSVSGLAIRSCAFFSLKRDPGAKPDSTFADHALCGRLSQEGRTTARSGETDMSQSATAETPRIKSRLAAILRATSGNFLEQFDFFLFGFYASAIAKAFFPSENETAALLNTFGVFWLGALMRPVGAIVLGAYIDQ